MVRIEVVLLMLPAEIIILFFWIKKVMKCKFILIYHNNITVLNHQPHIKLINLVFPKKPLWIMINNNQVNLSNGKCTSMINKINKIKKMGNFYLNSI